jgi:hypothetical protein
MTRYKQIHGQTLPFTAEEEAQRDADDAQSAIDAQAEKDAEDAKEANKASTKAKLEALGLTTDEVKDTFGL